MVELLLLQTGDPAGIGEAVKAVAAIGLAPTLLIIGLYAYKEQNRCHHKIPRRAEQATIR
jgi:hypothetical protein